MNPIPSEPNSEERIEPMPVPPDLLAWARQTFDMKEFMDGVADIEAGNGKTFEDLFAEIARRDQES